MPKRTQDQIIGKLTEPIEMLGMMMEALAPSGFVWVEVKNAHKYPAAPGTEVIVRGQKYIVLRSEINIAHDTMRLYLGQPRRPPAGWDQ